MHRFWLPGLLVLTIAVGVPTAAAGAGDSSPEGELIGRVQMVDVNRRVLQIGDEFYRVPDDLRGLYGLRKGDVVGISYVEENGRTRVTGLRTMRSSGRKGFSKR
jgi:hypothetical protein